MISMAVATAAMTFRKPANQISLMISMALLVAVVAYVTQGFYDMGLYWFRIAIVIGCLMGGLEAARRLSLTHVPSNVPAPAPQSAARGERQAKLGHAA